MTASIDDKDEELIRRFIEQTIIQALGKGHDAETTHAIRHERSRDALQFMNTGWFETYCLFVGYDPKNLRQLTYSTAMQEIPKEQIPITFEIEECV